MRWRNWLLLWECQLQGSTAPLLFIITFQWAMPNRQDGAYAAGRCAVYLDSLSGTITKSPPLLLALVSVISRWPNTPQEHFALQAVRRAGIVCQDLSLVGRLSFAKFTQDNENLSTRIERVADMSNGWFY